MATLKKKDQSTDLLLQKSRGHGPLKKDNGTIPKSGQKSEESARRKEKTDLSTPRQGFGGKKKKGGS